MASTYVVERSRSISAPPDRVFPLINDFHQWTRWSPWEDLDPDMQRAYTGNEAGPGAVYSWTGNRKAGAGRMEILESVPDRRVDIALDFDKPFKSSNRTTFALSRVGDDTEVSWRIEGPRPLLMRLSGFVFNMDKLVGGDFERGLSKLDTAATQTR